MASVERGGGKEGERRRVGAGGGNTALSFLLFHFAFFSVNENRQWATRSRTRWEEEGFAVVSPGQFLNLIGSDLDGKSRKALS